MPYFPRTLNPGPDEGDPSYRMAMLPFGLYPNAGGAGEHLGFAVPGMISEPVNALARLMGTPSNPGTFSQGPDNPQAASDMRTLLEATFGGNAINPAAAVPENALGMFGSLFKRKKNYDFWESATDAPTAMASSPKAASSRDMISGMSQPTHNPSDIAAPSFEDQASPIRAYHGTAADINGAFQPSEWGTFGPALYAAYDHPTMGPGADFAASFANMPSGGNYSGMLETVPDGAKIFPMNVNGKIATGEQYLQAFANAPGSTAAEKEAHAIASLQQQGFDGAAAHGEMGIWNRGTVTSPLTGETLFSDTGLPSLPGAVLAGAETNTPLRAYHGTAGDLVGGMFSRERAGNNFPNEVSKFGVSFDTNPDVAAKYAENAGIMPAYWQHLNETRRAPSQEMIDVLSQQSPAAIYPVDIYGRGTNLSSGFHQLGPTQMAAELQRLKDQGYDYAHFPSERGGGHHEINVWNPGTVRSALTGETLYSDGLPSLLGPSLQTQQQQYPNALFTY